MAESERERRRRLALVVISWFLQEPGSGGYLSYFLTPTLLLNGARGGSAGPTSTTEARTRYALLKHTQTRAHALLKHTQLH